MADGIEASSSSSIILSNNIVHSGTSCLSCINLKSELQRVQDDLKTAQFIIELLQKEVSSTSEQEFSRNYIHRKECGECDTDDWRQVRVSQATKKRVNLSPITDYCVPIANRYAVLNNLQESLNHFPKSVSPTPKTTSGKKKSLGVRKHTNLLIGDSHARGISERLTSHLGSSYQCTGYVKPNADLNIITSTASSAVKNLDKNDVVIMYGGAMDIARDNTASGLRSIRKFVQKCMHTNVLILNAHERFDLLATSCVNKEVVHYNRKMSKLIKCFDYAQVVKVDLQREQFTAHGMHVNRQGKDVTARCLVSAIRSIFIYRQCDSPIILKLGEDQQDRGSDILGFWTLSIVLVFKITKTRRFQWSSD
ncbi:hypothetical protein B7P43_G15717 [Cryptotermes secundus]|uniref:Uncharacterized protein n=1 Tax=Cryptotermes secundus TaxID=105785 RepID=A0A2J7RM06_9NEOP|nr:hypothetical protein B7P43_G15717 [Cryptotermes secundus]